MAVWGGGKDDLARLYAAQGEAGLEECEALG